MSTFKGPLLRLVLSVALSKEKGLDHTLSWVRISPIDWRVFLQLQGRKVSTGRTDGGLGLGVRWVQGSLGPGFPGSRVPWGL